MSRTRGPNKGEESDKDAEQAEQTEKTDDEAQEDKTPPPSWPLSFIWRDEDGSEADSGEATATESDEDLAFAVKGAPDFSVPWNQIEAVDEGGHRLTLRLHDGTALDLHKAGRGHDHLTSVVMAHFGKKVLKEALAEETLIEEFAGHATPFGGDGRDCRVLVYENALCLTFADGDVARLPFVFAGIARDGWKFDLSLPDGSGWTLGKLGRSTDSFAAAVDQALSKMHTRASEFVRTLAPALSPLKVRRLSGCFLDGRAAPKKDVLAAGNAISDGLVREIERVGLGPSWTALAALDTADRTRIGIKRGLVSGGKAYVFFMVPAEAGSGRRIVLEASSDASGSRATYVFDAGALSDQGAEAAMDVLNYGLYTVNFRREPVYLSNAQLQKPAYLRYRRALERIPALSVLRRAFVGRVMHNEDWNARLLTLLGTDAGGGDEEGTVQ
ncbi:MAG: hypothetical protein ACOX8O_01600 [Christensenellales bacterium]